MGPTSLILVPQVPGPGAGASHPGEGDQPGLAASLLAIIPHPGARVGPHRAGAGAAHAGEGDQGGVLGPAPFIGVDIRAWSKIFLDILVNLSIFDFLHWHSLLAFKVHQYVIKTFIT